MVYTEKITCLNIALDRPSQFGADWTSFKVDVSVQAHLVNVWVIQNMVPVANSLSMQQLYCLQLFIWSL